MAPVAYQRSRDAKVCKIASLRSGGGVAVFAVFSLVGSHIAAPTTAHAWRTGENRIETPGEDASAATGYGPGWVLLSYRPNCPGVGYLFAQGVLGKTHSDHMLVQTTDDQSHGYTDSPVIRRWPWGYAHGGYGGCAAAYGTSKFKYEQAALSNACTALPALPADRCKTSRFCTATASDPLCSRRGVWGGKDGQPDGKDAVSNGCNVYANIGHSGVFGSAPQPRNLLGYVPSGAQLDVRYVTKARQYVWAKWKEHQFSNGISWAFFPRSCVR
jgi:hypothetical protein